MPRDLAIFPLPLVLFPGARQALHIFEPRYRRLLADCLSGDRRFGIAYAEPSALPGADPAPAPGACGCVAVVRSSQPLPDGRSNILTEGERRFVLRSWLPRDVPYRVAEVEEFDDEPDDPQEAAALAVEVRAAFTRVEAALAALTDRDDEAHALPDEPGPLSFRVAGSLELTADVQLALLRSRSTTSRLRRLTALLGPLAADAEARAAVHRRGKRNGRGGPHAHIERSP
jgi:Lon protease-like protein